MMDQSFSMTANNNILDTELQPFWFPEQEVEDAFQSCHTLEALYSGIVAPSLSDLDIIMTAKVATPKTTSTHLTHDLID
jgi:hypothetical protein